MIKFSVIVPVYNVSTYLSECMESIIGQTYKNLEIICINDGSTDDSGVLLDMYAQKDERIKVIHKSNAGYGYTLNLGISIAQGDYISIVESDDYITPDMYEKLSKFILENNRQVDVLKACFYHVSKKECNIQTLFDSEMCERIIYPQKYIKLFWLPCSIWSAVYRKDFLIQNDIRCLETPGASYQDTSFWFKVLSTAKTMILTNEAVYFYRIDNIGSSINSDTKTFCFCEEVSEIERYITQKELDSSFLEGAKFSYIYRTYMWNYYRLPIGLRSAFWTEMLRKFMIMKQSCEFKNEYWKQDEWKMINDILADPETSFWKSDPIIKRLYFDQFTVRDKVYEEAIKSYIGRQNNIVIYGAGVYGRQVWKYIKSQEWNDQVIGFAVTKHSEQFEKIDGKRVYEIEELVKDKDMITVIVAVKETSQLVILKYLRVLQFSNVLRVDDAFWKLMNAQENSYDYDMH